MEQKGKIYRWGLIPLATTIAILIVVATYSVGVIVKEQCTAQIDSGISVIESYLKKNADTANHVLEEFEGDYAAEARAVAMLLPNDTQDNYDELIDDQTLEQLRVTVAAERISVFDGNNDLVASTDLSAEETTLHENFQGHNEDTVYTDVLFLTENNPPIVLAASSLGNGYMVEVTFAADNLVTLLDDADLSSAAHECPLYSSGVTAVLDLETLTYISCTDSDLVGETIAYDAELFEKSKGRINVKDSDGENAMLRYHKKGDYIILAIVPYADIYHTRNIVIGWLAVGGVILLGITALSLRMATRPKQTALNKPKKKGKI